MYTIIESPTFQTQVTSILSDDERSALIDWLSENPEAGDVVQGTQGARKIRWAAKGKGKRSGARVIYFNRLERGFIVLLAIYAKNEQENITAKTIKGLKNE